jgi:hypothetical protein
MSSKMIHFPMFIPRKTFRRVGNDRKVDSLSCQIVLTVIGFLGDAYPEYAASVLAGNDLMRSAFGAGFPLFARAMFDDLGVAWASSLLAFLAIAFIPIPFALYFVILTTLGDLDLADALLVR